MEIKSILDWIAFILTIIGALNWGLVGLFSLNLVELIFGSIAILETTVYVLVAISSLWLVYKQLAK